LPALSVDVKSGSLAVADSAAHAGVNQEQQATPLEHLASFAACAIRELNAAGLMTFHDMRGTERRRVIRQKLVSVPLWTLRFKPGCAAGALISESGFQQ
jgi:hypothetical protein